MRKSLAFSSLLLLSLPLLARDDARFLLEHQAFGISPSRRTLILGTQASEIVFHLQLDSVVGADASFVADFSGPERSNPSTLSLPGNLREWRLDPALFPTAGLYQLTNLRLLRQGQLLAFASPASVVVEVLDNILLTGVEVREMRQAELAQRGYIFNDNDYRVLAFQVSLITNSQPEYIELPIALPRSLERNLEPVILEDPLQPKVFAELLFLPDPPELTLGGGGGAALPVTGFYSLLLIPGELSYLKTHFAVTAVVFNGAAATSDFKVTSLKASLRLPNPTAGGLPLIYRDEPIKPVLQQGPDGLRGTEDDSDQLAPGQEGRAEFLLSGEIEGLYPVQVTVTGQLTVDGQALRIESVGRGRVYVRDADYTLTVEHPDVVSLDENYELSLTFHNVGAVPMENLHVRINPATLIGTEFIGENPEIAIASLAPGQEQSMVFPMRSKQTGKVAYSYIAAEGSSSTGLVLSVGVGDIGERLTNVSLIFPRCFNEQIPMPLRDSLRRYFKKLWDLAQMNSKTLPAGLLPLKPIKPFLEQMSRVAYEKESGLAADLAHLRLCLEWLRSTTDQLPVDLVRRKVLAEGSIPLEDQFGQLLSTDFAGHNPRELLEAIAFSAQNLSGLRVAILEGNPSELSIRGPEGEETDLSGKRELAFSSILPLGPERRLIWLGGDQAEIRLKVKGAREIHWLSFDHGRRLYTRVDLANADEHLFRHERDGGMNWQRGGSIAQFIDGVEVQPPTPALLFARQLDPTRNRDADVLGRHLMFYFNVPIDFASLDPLDRHFFINDQAVLAVKSPQGQQLLLVEAPMPLGPYKPIRYRIEGLKTQLGVVIPTLEGVVTPSLSYVGVSARGRVVDHGRGELRGARVFLMQNNDIPSASFSEDILPLSEGEKRARKEKSAHYPAVQETSLDEEGEYHFDFIALRAQRETSIRTFNRFKIGVLLADGRYKESLFETEDAVGAEIRADFAFGHRGKIYGRVLDDQGQPIPHAPIYVINQSSGLSSAITHCDELGRYEVEDLDVGQILVKSLSGQFLGRAGGYLTASNSPLQIDVWIHQDTAGSMSGRVFALDEQGVEQPIADAWVGLVMDETFELFRSELSYNFPYTVGMRTDAEGKYRLEGIKTGIGQLRFYHPKYGSRKRNMEVAIGENPNQDQLMSLAPLGSISGHVLNLAGLPVENATLRCGSFTTLSKADGSFQFSRLPLGNQKVEARKAALLGSAYFFLDQGHPRMENLILTLYAPVKILGTLVEDDGTPIPFMKINGFPEPNPPPTEKRKSGEDDYSEPSEYLVYSDRLGRWEYEFDPITTPFSQETANVSYWGFTGTLNYGIAERRHISFPGGGEHQLELRQRRHFPLNVRVVDPNGNPVICDVFLESHVPLRDELTPRVAVLGPAIGKTNQMGETSFPFVNEGPVTLIAESPLLGQSQRFHLDWMTPNDASQTILLAFEQTQQARIAGTVFDVDGIHPAPPGTRVQADFSISYDRVVTAQVNVDEQGRYLFAKTLDTSEAHAVRLTYFHPESGKFNTDQILLDQALIYNHDARLLGSNRLKVRVLRSDGSPVDAATVQLAFKKLHFDYQQLEYTARVARTTELKQLGLSQEFVEFDAVTAGEIQLRAASGLGLVALRTLHLSGDGSTVEINLRLEATSSISGIFLDEQGSALVDAEVRLFHKDSLLSQILSDRGPEGAGHFQFTDLPMRTYSLLGEDPATARTAQAQVTTTPFDPTPFVELQIDSTIELTGLISQNEFPIVGAEVQLETPQGQTFITASDAQGRYRYTDLAPGRYGIKVYREGHLRLASDGVQLSHGQTLVNKDILLARRADILLTVLGQDLLPRPHVTIAVIAGNMYAFTVVTDSQGKALLPRVPKHHVQFTLYDPHTDMRQTERIGLSTQDPDSVERTIQLKGWCTLYGQVLDGLGAPLRQSVPLYAAGESFTCDANGYYRVSYLPIGTDIEVRALNTLNFETALATVRMDEHGQEKRLDLHFSPSTSLEGQVTEVDGTPAAGAKLTLFRPVFRELRTDDQGRFRIEPILLGDTAFKLETKDRDQLKRGIFQIQADQDGQPIPVQGYQVILDPTAILNGSATYADGTLLTSGLVSLLDPNGKELEQAFVLSDGSWRFPRQPLGAYQLLLHDTTHEFDAQPLSVELTHHSQTLSSQLILPQDYSASGRLLSPADGAPISQGWVELWRPVDGKMRRLYAGGLNDQSYFVLPRVFPGLYQFKAWSLDQNMIFSGDWLIEADSLRDFPLAYRSSLLGSFTDSNGRPLTGQVTLLQNGLTTQLKVAGDGHFVFDSLVPGPYRLFAKDSNGWIQLDSQGQLLPGNNHLTLSSGPTFTLRGQAYLAAPARPGFRAELYLEDIGRPLTLDPSGIFEIYNIPINRPLFLKLIAGPLNKTIPLGSFQQDTDIGSHPLNPIKLDDTPPLVGFSHADQTLTSLPWNPIVTLSEPDPGSAINLETLQILINGYDHTRNFRYENGNLHANYTYFDRTMRRGANWIRIAVANTSNKFTYSQYNFTIQQDGTILLVQLLENDTPTAGTVRVEDGPWLPTTPTGQIVLPAMPDGLTRIKARSAQQGIRTLHDVESFYLTQELSLRLQKVGEYRGRVLGLDGAGLPGAIVSWKTDWERCDLNGEYRFDMLPLQQHTLTANNQSLFGQLTGPALTLPGQVVPNLDISLQGRGSITGRVIDQAGAPVPATTLELSYELENGSITTRLNTQTDASGNFRLDDVLTYPFRILAREPISGRLAYAYGQIPADGQSLELEIRLQAGAGVSGRILSADGSPRALLDFAFIDNSGPFRLQAQTDASGRFHLIGLPSGRTLTLKSHHSPSNQILYFETSLTNETTRELGDLSMTPNQRPHLSRLDFPAVVEPNAEIRATIQYSDDYQLSQRIVEFSGLYQQTLTHTHSDKDRTGSISTVFPRASQPGILNYRVTITDFAGLESSYEGQIRVEEDLSGPAIQIDQPLPGLSFREGDLLRIQGRATDPDGVASVELRYQGQLLASVNSAAFSFDSFLPDVSEDSTIAFELLATDRDGHRTSLLLPLSVQARQSQDPPTLLVRSPLDRIPLPLHLPQGLDLLLSADFEDTDGLASYQWRLNGNILASNLLWGPQDSAKDLIHLPALEPGLESLELELLAFDIGGQSARTRILIHHIDGTLVSQPLALSPLDQSYEGQSLILVGGTHLIDGTHNFQNLVLVNGAKLSQTATSSDQTTVAQTRLLIAHQLVIEGTASIDLDEKGYPSAPNQMASAQSGSYAGPSYSGNLNSIYGSFLQPLLPGSGKGGGALYLQGRELWLAGPISAGYANPNSSQAHIGTGGSLWIIGEQFHGHGPILANAYPLDQPKLRSNYGGSGGRIRIDGPFTGEAHAGGGNRAGGGGIRPGSGTLYRRIPDSSLPDGYLDLLTLAADPLTLNASPTLIPLPGPLIAGQQVRRTTVTENGATFDILDLFLDQQPPPQSLLGMRVYRQGDPPNGGIVAEQRVGQLRSAPGTSFGTFNDGDILTIDFQLDRIEVRDQAAYHPGRHRMSEPLHIHDASLHSPEPYDFSPSLLEAQGTTYLKGSFALHTFDFSQLQSLKVDGSLQLGPLQLLSGRHEISGLLQTPSLTIGADAILQLPPGRLNESLQIEADQIRIDGTLRAAQQKSSGLGSPRSHAGQGYGETTCYGSLYLPTASGSASSQNAGGALRLSFQELVLQGLIEASPDPNLTGTSTDGTGGSILLQGQTLSGSGQIRASAREDSSSGGGRIALHVQHLEAFQGLIQTFGGNLQNPGAPGTIFFHTDQWPDGKLLVQNRPGQSLRDLKTFLPGLGTRTAAIDTGNGPIVEGQNFPNDLSGLYLKVPNHAPVRIDHNSATQLFAEPGQNFPPILAGQSYSGLHILDRLEVLDGAQFYSPDPIQLAQPALINAGSSILDTQIIQTAGETTYTNEDAELPNTGSFPSIRLVNSRLRINNPVQVGRIDLDAGSVLELNQTLDVDTLVCDGGKILFQSKTGPFNLTAGMVELRNGASWRVGPTDYYGQSIPLRALIRGSLLVDATSSIRVGTAGTSQRTGIPWNGSYIDAIGNGGFASYKFSQSTMFGSFARPQLAAKETAGAIHIQAQQLQLDGEITADWESGSTAVSGGSIWLEAQTLAGSGLISARGYLSSGGGRIAIHYGQDDSFLSTLRTRVDLSSPSSTGTSATGHGTLFLKSAQQNYGRLILDQGLTGPPTDTLERRSYLQGITGPASLSLLLDDQDPDPLVVYDPSWTHLPPGLAGLVARVQVDGQTHHARIANNDPNKLYLLDPLPPLIPAGSTIDLVLMLDQLELRNGAQLQFAGDIEAAQFLHSGSWLNSIWARNFTPPTPDQRFLIQNSRLKLVLEQPHWDDIDLEVIDGELDFDKPIRVRDIRLTRSLIRNSYRYTHEAYVPVLDLSARDVIADETSRFAAPNEAHNGMSTSYGGYNGTQPTFGNLFHPVLRPAERPLDNYLRLQARSLQGGNFDASSPAYYRAAGPIQLDIQQLGGTVRLDASATRAGAGRIAVHYDSLLPGASILTDTRSATATTANVSAGTAFLRGSTDTFGHLIIDNGPNSSKTQPTPIPTIGTHTLAAGFQLQPDPDRQRFLLRIPGLTLSENYRDYFLTLNAQPQRSTLILDSLNRDGAAEFLLAADPGPLLVGDQLQLALWLDSLTLGPNASLLPPDLLLFDQLPPSILSIQAPTQSLPGQPFQIQVQAQDNVQLHLVRVTFNGQTQSAAPQTPFTFTAPSPSIASDYPILVEVLDRTGLSASQTQQIRVLEVDILPPTLTFTAPAPDARIDGLSPFTAELSLLDNRALAQVSLQFNGQSYSQNFADSITSATAQFPLVAPQVLVDTAYPLTATLTDRVGLSTTVTLQVLVAAPDSNASQRPPIHYWTFDTRDTLLTHPRDVIGGFEANFTNRYSTAVRDAAYGQAFVFSTAANRVEVPNLPPPGDGSSFSLATWLKIPSFKDGGGVISYGSESQEGWALTTRATGGNRLRFSVAGSSLETGTLTTNTWYYLVATFDRGQASLYLDGQLQTQAQLSTSAIPTLANAWLAFGVYQPGTDITASVQLDEVLIWDHALSPATITQHHQQWLSQQLDLRPPEPVTQLRVLAQPNSFELRWTPSANLAGDLLTYQLLIQDREPLELPPGQTSLLVENLDSLTPYLVKVVAIDTKGNASPPAVISAVTSAAPAALPQPIAEFSFNTVDRNGNFPLDLQGNLRANAGSYSTLTAGQLAEAGSYNSSQKTEFVDQSILESDSFTLSLWIRPTSSTTHGGRFLSFGSRSREFYSLQFLSSNSANGNGFRFQAGSGSTATSLDAGFQLGSNNRILRQLVFSEWRHIALSYDLGQVRLYLDGILQSQADFGQALGSLAGGFLCLGKDTLDANSLNGSLDELKIWNQALSPQLIALIAQSEQALAPLDFRPPESPTSLRITPSLNALALTWNPSPDTKADLDLYQIEVNGQTLALLPKTSLSYQLSGLQPGSVYRFNIRALDRNGRASAPLQSDAVTLSDPSLYPKPFHYWSFDLSDRSSNLPLDLRGRATPLYVNIPNNLNYPGKSGAVGDISGTAYYGEWLASPPLLSHSFALSTWIRTYPNSFSTNGTIFSLGNKTNERFSLSFLPGATKQLRVQAGDKTGTYHLDFGSRIAANNQIDQELPISSWFHLALSYHQGQLDLFLDGNPVASTTWPLEALPQITEAFLTLGRRSNGLDPAAAILDELCLWDQPLDPSFVLLLYQTGLTGNNFKGPLLDFLPPAEITNLRARPGQNALSVTWAASTTPTPELAGYRLYLDDQLHTELSPTLTQAELTALQPSALHQIRLAAFDAVGNESAGLTLPAATLPAVPGSLPSPLSYWSLDTTSKLNNLFRDQAGSNHATLNSGGIQTPAVSKEGFRFYSSSHKIEIPKSTSLDTFQAFTLFAWAYTTTPRHNAGLITYASETLETYGLGLGIDAASGNYFQLKTSGAGTPESLASPVLRAGTNRIYDHLLPNRWYQLAATFDRGQVVLYRDGTRIASSTWNTTELPADSLRKLVLGLYHPGTDISFTGYLDEVAIWNRALTQAEIRVFYLRGLRNEPLWLPNDSKRPLDLLDNTALFDRQGLQATQLADYFRSPDSFEDADNIVLVNEDFQLRDFQTDKRLWLHNSQLQLQGQLQATSVHLLQGSLLTHPPLQSRPEQTRLIAHHLQIDADSRIDLDGMGLPEPSQTESGTQEPTSGGAIQIQVRELLLDGSISARGTQDAPAGTLDIKADHIQGQGLITGNPAALLPDSPETDPAPQEPDPDRPTHDDKAILPKKRSRPKGPSPSSSRRPLNSPPTPKEKAETLRIKGQRKQTFKHLKKRI